MWALRGLAADYDGWASDGAVGWSWSDVLPYFRKLERDADFQTGEHGTDGPVAVRRDPYEDWPGFTKTLTAAAGKKQLRMLPDLNATDEDGIFAIPLSIENDNRVSSASAYLTSDVRRRANLTILSGTEVRNLAFDGKKVIGAHIRRNDGNVALFRANEVVLSAGAMHSPRFCSDRELATDALCPHPASAWSRTCRRLAPICKIISSSISVPLSDPAPVRIQPFADMEWSVSACPQTLAMRPRPIFSSVSSPAPAGAATAIALRWSVHASMPRTRAAV